MSSENKRCVIIGGGPAGLTAALELARGGVAPVVLEADDVVGGISRTVSYKGYRFDIGGHRFFTKSDRVHQWWMDVLGDEFLLRPRLSRIYYKGRFFDYPLKPWNALSKLGYRESALVGFSFLGAQLFPHPEERNLEQWVTNRFGRRLYEMFFKTYTEKVWGMECTEIRADWAAQRIKDLDLKKAIFSTLLPKGASRHEQTATLIEQFHYPRYGPGQLWERVASLLREFGHPVRFNRRVNRLYREGDRIIGITASGPDGHEKEFAAEQFISSMPIRELVRSIRPMPPEHVLEAADGLRYRDFLTVGLIVDAKNLFPDNWIYVHSPEVKVGRIQNFGNWSPWMVPDENRSSIGLEYFVQQDDELWSASDEALIQLATEEVAKLNLLNAQKVVDGVVIRMPKAYPVYDHDYWENLTVVREYLDEISNLQPVGRNGQHRYNNQDHSMLTAIYAAENVMGGQREVWNVNVGESYHESTEYDGERGASGDRAVPARVEQTPAEVVNEAFAKYDPVALGTALATIFGMGMFFATVALLLGGGEEPGAHLALLGNFFLGYEVSWPGTLVGGLWGMAMGFAVGYGMALAINLVVSLHLNRLLRTLGIVVGPQD